MTITFFSNFLNHHQTPFCDEMFKQLNSDFTFVSTEKIPYSFVQSGYHDCSDYIYNLNSYIDDNHYKKAIHLGLSSDIVIIGSAPEFFVRERIHQNKHTFRYSERMLKKGQWKLLNHRILLSLLQQHTIHRKKNIYMLCAGAYTSNDLKLILAYPGKKFKWGYFTEVEELKIEQIIAQKPTECIEIIWVARFIEWKHPELPIKLAYELKKKGYNFHINMIGVGEMVSYIQKLIRKLDVSECVSLFGNIPNSEVKRYLQTSNIFVFTSDRNEGWGAVLNEAMSCGCAVVASNTIGAVPYLIENKINGLVFKSGSLSSLLKQTETLIKDKLFSDKLGFNAYKTISNEWSPKRAASNFLLLSRSLLDGQIISIKEGPCSIAGRMNKNFWEKY
jgi:glycosyltransferase involved in cell wall biosynthesis